MNGILGTGANIWADLSLISIILFGLIALFGGLQAKKKKFTNHCPVMAVVAFLNWIPILIVMIPRALGIITGSKIFSSSLIASIPIFHSILGAVTQLLLTYTVIRMYWLVSLPPKKPIWLMRTALIMWSLTIIGGLGVYILFYII